MKKKEGGNKKVYVVIDTNVLVSALLSNNPETPPYKIIEFIYTGPLIHVYNEEIINEYEDVLSRKKFHFSKDAVRELLDSLREIGIKVDKSVVTEEFFPDPDDIVFYEVRMSVDDSYLITGNKRHFPQKPYIVTPSEMVSILHDKNLI